MIASVGKASPGMPDWWDSRSRIVISRVTSGSFTRNHGRCSTTGSSQWTIPSSTRAPIAAAPNDLETEPTWKRVWGSTGSSRPSSLTPKPSAKTTSSPCTTATASPGRSQSAMDASMKSERPASLRPEGFSVTSRHATPPSVMARPTPSNTRPRRPLRSRVRSTMSRGLACRSVWRAGICRITPVGGGAIADHPVVRRPDRRARLSAGPSAPTTESASRT